MKATYNITNDKLKFWPEERLPKETYDRARHAGFTFWHGSKCFAAKWSTQAEDLVLELGGVIEQDDSPDDVEARVERFSKYADGAQQQAESSEEYLNTKANTERRRKNAINSMEKGISQAEHWKQRIEGAIRNATYKERPDVIARRIEGLEKDLRKMLRNQDRKNFNVPEDCYDREAYAAYNRRKLVLNGQLNEDKKNDKPWTQAQKDVAIAELRELRSKVFFEDKIAAAFKPTFDWAQRWIDHINQRLQYERASLEAAGGVVGGVGAAPMDKEKFQVGGAVKGGVSGDMKDGVTDDVTSYDRETVREDAGKTLVPTSGIMSWTTSGTTSRTTSRTMSATASEALSRTTSGTTSRERDAPIFWMEHRGRSAAQDWTDGPCPTRQMTP